MQSSGEFLQARDGPVGTPPYFQCRPFRSPRRRRSSTPARGSRTSCLPTTRLIMLDTMLIFVLFHCPTDSLYDCESNEKRLQCLACVATCTSTADDGGPVDPK
ncbi:hypothetical protein E4U60_004622 [Claviceps pazoutovae]|uniref:Uncharacterized protein n=1 Tax=Claviceps pazoutovae TaxID=1649127 RepID=A0A9P7SFR3_9HYPO|nr:hypothetical protein E4U60_004622 [Claviceps pazoutovae]